MMNIIAAMSIDILNYPRIIPMHFNGLLRGKINFITGVHDAGNSIEITEFSALTILVLQLFYHCLIVGGSAVGMCRLSKISPCEKNEIT
jgi:hypothetical protein